MIYVNFVNENDILRFYKVVIYEFYFEIGYDNNCFMFVCVYYICEG